MSLTVDSSVTAGSNASKVDVAITGAGPVGMALAAMLVRAGMAPDRVALIDGRTLEAAQRDPRSIAVSHGSRQLLEQIGAWPWQDGAASASQAQTAHVFGNARSMATAGQDQAGSATPIEQIHVSRRGSLGRTLISASEFGLPALGYVIRYGDLVRALAQSLQQAGVVTLRPAQVLGHEETAESVRLSIKDSPALEAAIMVVAEGGVFATPVQENLPAANTSKPGRSAGNSASRSRVYEQTAVIAFVKTASGVGRRAYERFTEEGPLALLPQADGYALVWCVRPAHATDLLALDEQQFLEQLQQAFGQRLGRFLSAGVRSSYPLGLKTDDRQTARRVSIGNAAQTLHPVAGQGLNLGMRDAAVLAQLLVRGAGNGISPETLADFTRARRDDRGTIVQLTDLMARVFTGSADGSFRQGVLGLSLGLVDGLTPAKRLLGEWMMFGLRR